MLENYVKTVRIEAVTMNDMARKQIIPSVADFAASTANAVSVKKSVSEAACKYETKLVTELTELIDEMDEAASALENAVAEFDKIADIIPASEYIRDTVLPAMDKLRASADKAESLTAETYWPFPAYDKLLFGV